MRHSQKAARLVRALSACALLSASLAAGSALAQPIQAETARARSLTVAKDKSIAFHLDAAAGEVVVAQPDIAQIVATTDRSFYVRGKGYGATNILVYDTSHRLMEVIDVRVSHDTEALQADLAATFPGEPIKVRAMGDGYLLTGQASTNTVSARALNLAERYAPKAVTSAMTVRDSQQVILEVRIVEASRSALQDFGIDASVSTGNVSFSTGSGLLGNTAAQGALAISGRAGKASMDMTIRALEEKGVLHTLAKPNLAAVSGEEASFLAGGEFPFPIPQGRDAVAIEFRPFGVTLKFTPTVQENGFIRLKVAPEVSQLDTRNALRINGFDVPSLTVRRAGTTIDLRDGQSFAIAGLFQQDYVDAVRQLPGLGDVPVIGALFRSARWKRQETELVIIVTPRITTSQDILPNPMAGASEPQGIDLILKGQSLDRPLIRPVGGSAPGPIASAEHASAPSVAIAAPAPKSINDLLRSSL